MEGCTVVVQWQARDNRCLVYIEREIPSYLSHDSDRSFLA